MLPNTDYLWMPCASNKFIEPNNAGYSKQHLINGWSIFDNEIAHAYNELGMRAIFFHRPFGEPDNNDYMDLDSRAEIIDSPHKYDNRVLDLIHNFIPWVKSLLATYNDLHIICYVGSTHDSSMEERLRNGRFNEWLDRFNRSILPITDLNSNKVHLAFDASSKYIETDPVAWKMINTIRTWMNSHNRECIMEALANPNYFDEQKDWPSTCLERFWWNAKTNSNSTMPPEQRMSNRQTIRIWNGHAINKGAWGAIPDNQETIISAFNQYKSDCDTLGCIACYNPRLDGIIDVDYAKFTESLTDE